MNQVFQGLFRKFVLVFFDYILVYSSSWTAHMHHLDVIMQILKKNQLFAKLSKCSFRLQQVDYLGYMVSGSGVSMDQAKVQVVL